MEEEWPRMALPNNNNMIGRLTLLGMTVKNKYVIRDVINKLTNRMK